MAWKSGSTRYVVHESPEQVIAGVRALAESEGLRVIEAPTRAGVRLTIEAVDAESDTAIPSFDVGEVELRFASTDGRVAVEVRSRRRRRWWTLGVVAILGVGTVFVDLVAAMGFMTLELGRAIRRSKKHHLEADPLLLQVVSSFLGPRDLGELDAAPFRGRLPR